jgi:hypothetical protein
MAKTWTLETIREKIATDNRMVERSLVQLFNRQTAHEQHAETTEESNGVGFNGVDAEILSSFAKQVIRQQNSPTRPEGTRLSSRQLEIARKKLPKYARQLLSIWKEKNS